MGACGTSERTGVVVIRVWLEGAATGRALRARTLFVPDVERGEAETAVAGSAEEIIEGVRRFVDEFVGRAPP
jgi:hypothetical protein